MTLFDIFVSIKMMQLKTESKNNFMSVVSATGHRLQEKTALSRTVTSVEPGPEAWTKKT